MKTFTLTDQHLTLMKHMVTSWDDTEFGAPSIDPKRPYGNSGVYADMGEILGIGNQEKWNGVVPFTQEEEARMHDIHAEMRTAIEIVLKTGAFEPGNYAADDYDSNWHKAVNEEIAPVNMASVSPQRRFEDKINEILALRNERQKLYGDRWIEDSVDEHFAALTMKFKRAQHLLARRLAGLQETREDYESLDDTLKDLCVYALFLLCKKDMNREMEVDTNEKTGKD